MLCAGHAEFGVPHVEHGVAKAGSVQECENLSGFSCSVMQECRSLVNPLKT